MSPRRNQPRFALSSLHSSRAAVLFGLLVLSLPATIAGPATSPETRTTLSVMFPAGGRLRVALLAAYDRDGLAGAMEAYRRAHAGTAAQPYYRVAPDNRPPEQIRKQADGILGVGFAFEGHPAFALHPPINWAADPYRDRSWRVWLNALGPLDDVLAAHARSHDRRYLNYAEAIACDWINSNPPAHPSSGFAWYDMAVGLRGLTLAHLVDAAVRDPDTDQATVWSLLRGAWVHGVHLAQERNFNPRTNHGIYQAAGLLALAKSLPELAASERWRSLGEERMRAMFGRFFSSEGVHLEHSPGYHLALTCLLEATLDSGLIQDRELAALRSRAEDCLAWLVAPDGSLPRLGDTDSRTVGPADFGLPERKVEPALAYVLTRGRLGKRPTESYRVLPEAGYVVFRGGWPEGANGWEDASYLIFAAGFHSRTHKHADDLTFEWWDAGRALIVDSGRYGYYYDDPRRVYCESTRAHNTVVVDERNSSRDARGAFGSALRTWGEGDGAYHVTAEVEREELGLRHRRTLVFRPTNWLVVVDEFESTRPHHYTQWFHFAPDLAVTLSGSAATAALPGGQALQVLPLADTGEVRPTLVRGQTRPVLQGWTSYGSRTIQENWALGYSRQSRSVALATLLHLGPGFPQAAGPAIFAPDQIHLEWRSGDQREGFVLHRGASPNLSVISAR